MLKKIKKIIKKNLSKKYKNFEDRFLIVERDAYSAMEKRVHKLEEKLAKVNKKLAEKNKELSEKIEEKKSKKESKPVEKYSYS